MEVGWSVKTVMVHEPRSLLPNIDPREAVRGAMDKVAQRGAARQTGGGAREPPRQGSSSGSSCSGTPKSVEPQRVAQRMQPARRSPSLGSADEDISSVVVAKRSSNGSQYPSTSPLAHAGSMSVLARPQRRSGHAGPAPLYEELEKSVTCPPGELVQPRPVPAGKHLLRATTPPAGRPTTPEVTRTQRKAKELERERTRATVQRKGVLTIPFHDNPDGSPSRSPPPAFIDSITRHDDRQKQRRGAASTSPAALEGVHGAGAAGRALSSSSSRKSTEVAARPDRGSQVQTLHAPPLSGARTHALAPLNKR